MQESVIRPATVFADIDGVILPHIGKPRQQWWTDFSVSVPGACNFLSDLESTGARIVLVTARPRHCRAFVEGLLRKLEITYHDILYGCTSGLRVVINDAKPEREEPTALGLTVKRNCPDFEYVLKQIREAT